LYPQQQQWDSLLGKRGAPVAAAAKSGYVSYWNVMLQQQTAMPISF
jgi:hypothetical protein